MVRFFSGCDVRPAIARAFDYLRRVQRADGSWVPLWFGNQRGPNQENPVYGTSRVLLCAGLNRDEAWRKAVLRALTWLTDAQNPDGGFGGAPGIESTIEETALATEALASHPAANLARLWLAENTRIGTRFDPSPFGLYFAKLWYWERLYPLIFTAAALGRGPS